MQGQTVSKRQDSIPLVLSGDVEKGTRVNHVFEEREQERGVLRPQETLALSVSGSLGCGCNWGGTLLDTGNASSIYERSSVRVRLM